ncbi:MAG: gamma-glutamyltransferase [Rhodospirillales bacterium]|nr:gamma-glutamyltransferase [Rhodospirillales bacterium]MDH3791371.1 gamma-glutamyltransferase [Rhodospirillales bacterium]MDH3909809.1 gamma-glutamyltransferase [Rhodospirillales bacterium]MDH3919227.1 gamma-glutamyltransferase [Rhodospirillales bacterium]MDH3968687.1 gamma-glutamyltransferase [Rhodospirillales bacterium]
MTMLWERDGRSSRRAFMVGIFGLTALAFLAFAASPTAWAQERDVSLGVPGVNGGVVTTSEPQAAQVGARVLRAGGNAIDAAVAVQFALNVLEPQSSGIGGGGFMMIHLAKSKKTFVVDSRETAPAAADPGMFLLASDPSSAFPFGIRSTSGIAVGVPGTLRGVATALESWGTMPLSQLLQPAIEMTEQGIRVSSRLAESVLNSRLDSEPGNSAYDHARAVFRPGGVPLAEGDLLVQPDLAKTLKKIAEQGPDAFYGGEIAQAIVDTQRNARSLPDPRDQAKLVGRMTLADLANYRPAIRQPVTGDYRGLRIVSMPPPSSGGLTVIQILKLLERFPIGDESKGFGFGSTKTLHVMIEAMRLAFADRAVWMGDDDFVDVPSKGLLDNAYIALRSKQIDPGARRADVQADDPRPFDTAALPAKVELAALALPDEEGVNTTHFTVVDRDGNIVTYTSTIESTWGTGLMVPGFGFLLNNELTDFNRIPAFNPDPDAFDPGANDVAPGKRPRSSMAPTMVFRDGQPRAAFGSPGGSTIIDTVVNVAMNLIDHEMPVQEAVDAPRIAQTSANGATRRELGFSEAALEGLAALGHSLRDPGEIGSVQAVVLDRRGQRQFGAADKRRIGGVVSLRRARSAAE